jgi:hypothetical protein
VTNLSLTIPTYVESQADKTIIFYVIQVTKNVDNWKLEKRFSDFHDLHKTLGKIFPNLPSFPSKSVFKPKDPDALRSR